MISGPWHIQMLGGLRIQQADYVRTRFRTHQAALLLARLALFPHRSHPREELTEFLWPEQDAVVGRNRLRVTLHSLRHQIEPPGIMPQSVLVADRTTIKLNPLAVTTDVTRFGDALAAAERVTDPRAQAHLWEQAIRLYQGELLPGFYEEWVETERQILEEKYAVTLRHLIQFWETQGDYAPALIYALRAATADPYHEVTHQAVIRLYVRLGQPAAARRHYRGLEQRLRDDLNIKPSAMTRAQLQFSAEAAGMVSSAVLPSSRYSTAVLLPDPSPKDVHFELPTPMTVPRLPLLFTHFFGRQPEIARLQEWLTPDPDVVGGMGGTLVTLTGPGGSGKTRLALEATRAVSSLFPGGIWFVPLADLTDANQILPQLLAVLGLAQQPQVDLLALIRETLARTPVLLLFDNLEHLVGGEDVVQAIRERVTGLTCLATSRRPLGLPGEREYPVLPLPIPEPTDDLFLKAITPDALMTIPSVQLFVDRAQRVRPDFVVTRRNAADIAALCRQLEGIPLAVELAAARVRALAVSHMRERLTEKFDLLVNPQADKTARHRSLRTALEWSYQMLSVAQRRLLAGLSVFRGGWGLEAAEAVCGGPSVLEGLEQLRVNSLILLDEERTESGIGEWGEPRFRMLEAVRRFAAVQVSYEEQCAFSLYHARFYVSMAESADLIGPERWAWSMRLGTETDNIRAMLDWGAKTEHPEGVVLGLRLCVALMRYWKNQGWAREGYHSVCLLLDRAKARESDAVPMSLWAQGKVSAGALACSLGETAAAEVSLTQALVAFQALDDAKGIGDALHTLGVALGERQPEEAWRCYEESLAIRQQLGNKCDIAATLNNLALARSGHKKDYDVGMVFQAQALFREDHNLEGVAGTYHTLALLYEGQGDQPAALSALQSSAALFQQLGEKLGMALILTKSGLLSWEQGDLAGAQASLHQGLILSHQLGYLQCVAGALKAVGAVTAATNPARAARLVGAAARLIMHLSGQSPVPPSLSERTDWELGWAMSQEQAIQEALRGLAEL